MTTALSYYMLPYEASGPGQVNSIAGTPIIVNPYAPPGKVYFFKNEIITDHIDTLLMAALISKVRKEARSIVQRKMKEALPWLRV